MDVPRVRSFDPHTPNNWGGSSELPVDLNHLRRYTLGDKALEQEVLRLFLAQLPETIASLRSAATERDWKMAAHTLKGSSRAVGAWRIASLAQEAEGPRLQRRAPGVLGGDIEARSCGLRGQHVRSINPTSGIRRPSDRL